MRINKVLLSVAAVMMITSGYPIDRGLQIYAVELEEPITLRELDGMAVKIKWRQPENKKKSDILYYLLRCKEPNGNYEQIAKLSEDTTSYIDVLDNEGTYYYKLVVSTDGKKENESKVEPVAITIAKADNIFTSAEEATDYLKKKIEAQETEFKIVYLGETKGNFVKSDDNVSIKVNSTPYYKKDGKRWYLVEYTASYEMTNEELEYSDKMLEEILESDLSSFVNATNADKVKAVYKYLALRIALVDENTNVYTVLKDKKGNSRGIAKTAKRLLDLLNVDSYIVHNDSGYWNICRMADGLWYDVDIAREIKSLDKYEYMRYDYLLTNRTKEHETTDKSNLETCTEKWKFNMVQPTNLSAYTDADGFKITWNLVDHAEGYQVQRSTTRDGTYTDVISYEGQPQEERGLTKTNEIIDINAQVGQTYYYRVKAYSFNKGEREDGLYSDVLKVTYLGDTPLVINTSSISPYLQWSEIDGAAKYAIYRKEAGKDEELLAEVTDTCYTDRSASLGVNYSYRIKVGNQTPSGLLYEYYSNYVTTYGIREMEATEGGLKLTIKDRSETDTLRVYRYNNKTRAFSVIGTTDNDVFVDTNVKEGYTYVYTVAPIAEGDTGTVVNIKASSKEIALLNTPQLAIGKENGIPVVSWVPVSDAVAYELYTVDDNGPVLYASYGCSENLVYMFDKKDKDIRVYLVAVSATGSRSMPSRDIAV